MIVRSLGAYANRHRSPSIVKPRDAVLVRMATHARSVDALEYVRQQNFALLRHNEQAVPRFASAPRERSIIFIEALVNVRFAPGYSQIFARTR